MDTCWMRLERNELISGDHGRQVSGYGSIKPYPQMEFAEPWLYQSLEVERGDPFWDEMLCNPSYHEFENVDISVIPEARVKKELKELDFATLALVDCGLLAAPVVDLDEEEAIRKDSEPVAGSSDSEPEETAPLMGASDSTTTRLLPGAEARADQGSRQGFLTRVPTFMPRASSANTELKQMQMTPGRGLWAGSFHDPANYFHVWYLIILFGAMLWGLVAIVDRWDLVLVYHHVLEWTWIVFNIVTSYDVIFLLTVPLPIQDQWEGERRAKSPLYLDPPRLNPRRMDLMQMYPEKYLNDLRKNFNPINVWPDPLMTVYPPMPGFE
eukprot:gene8032-9544_t